MEVQGAVPGAGRRNLKGAGFYPVGNVGLAGGISAAAPRRVTGSGAFSTVIAPREWSDRIPAWSGGSFGWHQNLLMIDCERRD
jgi:hypothetical protein